MVVRKKKLFVIVFACLIFLILFGAYIISPYLVYFHNTESTYDTESNVLVEKKNISIQDLEIVYYVAGNENNPPLILIHGSGGSYDQYSHYRAGITAKLAEKFRVYAPERPGYLTSQTPTEIRDMVDDVEFLKDFTGNLQIENPIIIGQSFGGKLATFYAHKYPNDVRLLVLGDTSPSYKDTSVKNYLKTILGRTSTFILNSSLVPTSAKHVVATRLLSIPEEAVDTNNYQKYSIVTKSFTQMNKQYLTDEEFGEISTPAIIIWGDKDDQLPSSIGERTSKLLPNAKFVIYEGKGHGAVYEDLERTVELIQEEVAKNP